jgi:hypothetical protein
MLYHDGDKNLLYTTRGGCFAFGKREERDDKLSNSYMFPFQGE